MPPHRLPRHNHAASRDTHPDYSYNDHENHTYPYYNDPARSTQNYHDNRVSGHSDQYDARGQRGWEEHGYYGGQSSRYDDYSTSTGDTYRSDGGYSEWDYGSQQGYGNYSSYNHGYSERQDFNYRSYGSNHRQTYNRNSYGRNTGEQQRRYHTSRPQYNESNPGTSQSDLRSRFFQHTRDNFVQVDTARVLRDRKSPRQSPPRTKMSPDEDYLKTSLEVSTQAGVAGDLDVDDRTVVRKLLVLDLNGTLVYRSPHRMARVSGRGYPEDDVYAQFDPSQSRPIRAVHPRPYLSSFREYLFHPKTRRWLDTMVWSSAQPHSVNDMVMKSLGDKKDGLVAIWARDKLGLGTFDYGRKVQTTKDLNKPWNELNATTFDPSDVADPSSSSSSIPQKRSHSAKTTLLLDDSPLKAHLQPYNHLCLKEYDSEMRKHDMAIRELEVARVRLADAISKRENVADVIHETESKDKNFDLEGATDKPDEDGAAALGAEDTQSPAYLDSQEHGEETNNRKRRRKEKKENKKKDRDEGLLRKLTDEYHNIGGVYDETLLAVVGILDTVKTESNVAAWIRAGGLIQSLSASGGKRLEKESSLKSAEEAESPKKKIKLSENVSSPLEHEDHRSGEKKKNSVNRTSTSDFSDPSFPPPRASSPARASLPPSLPEELDPSSETERTGVPMDNNARNADKGKEAGEMRLWFDHPGTIPYWASRGRAVLEGMGIDIVADVVGSTG